MLAPIVDDAHLMEIDALRRLRLLFEDFPKNHNLILIAQPALVSKLSLTVNDDIKSRVTYSTLLAKLAPDDLSAFILAELDRVALGHNVFTDEALSLIVRSSEGVLRAARNLCVASLLEAVRDHNHRARSKARRGRRCFGEPVGFQHRRRRLPASPGLAACCGRPRKVRGAAVVGLRRRSAMARSVRAGVNASRRSASRRPPGLRPPRSDGR
jgi:hypothetical protein